MATKHVKPKLEDFQSSVMISLTDGERTLYLGRVRLEWQAPAGHVMSHSEQFWGGVMAVLRHYSAMLNGLELRHIWVLQDDDGHAATLQEIDRRILQAKESKEPMTIKRMGFSAVWVEENAAA